MQCVMGEGAVAFEVTPSTQGFLKRQGPYTYQEALQNQSSFLISKILFYQPFLQTAYIRLNMDSYQRQLQSGAHGHASCSKCSQADLELSGELFVAGLWVAGLRCLR